MGPRLLAVARHTNNRAWLGRDDSARPCNHGSSEPFRRGGQFMLYPPPPRVKVATPHPEVHGDLAHYPRLTRIGAARMLWASLARR